MPKSHPPAQPDAIGMADALDYEEEYLDDGNRGNGLKIRDQVTLKKSPPPNSQTFEPDFGAPRDVKVKGAPSASATPQDAPTYRPGLPVDPRQVQAQKEKLADTGTTYAPEQPRFEFPEVKTTTVDGAAPSMGSMVTNIPSFAQAVYGDNAPNKETYSDPLAKHGKDADKTPPTTQVNAPPPPIGSQPAAPAPVTAPAPAPAAPRAVTPARAAPAPAPAPAQTTNTATSEPAAQEVPKNAKKVVTTTTTTTKIVDGKEVVETHVHHDVVVKKKGFSMPKLFGKKKKTITTTTTTDK